MSKIFPKIYLKFYSNFTIYKDWDSLEFLEYSTV